VTEDAREAQAEVERLRKRCEILSENWQEAERSAHTLRGEIERLRAEIERLRAELEEQHRELQIIARKEVFTGVVYEQGHKDGYKQRREEERARRAKRWPWRRKG
jgi:predicted  nucleic acid-binding Zn-ribbon protein